MMGDRDSHSASHPSCEMSPILDWCCLANAMPRGGISSTMNAKLRKPSSFHRVRAVLRSGCDMMRRKCASEEGDILQEREFDEMTISKPHHSNGISSGRKMPCFSTALACVIFPSMREISSVIDDGLSMTRMVS